MADRTQRDTILNDVPAVRHQVPVGDVMSIKLRFRRDKRPTADAALLLITSENSVPEVGADRLLRARHQLKSGPERSIVRSATLHTERVQKSMSSSSVVSNLFT